MLMPLKRKVFLMIGRAILSAVSDTEGTQLIKISGLKDEVLEDVEKHHDFGFTSNAPVDDNTESIVFYMNGDRGNGVCLSLHNRELRVKSLESGAVCIYSKDSAGDNQNRIMIKPTNNTISIETADGNQVTLDSTSIHMEDVNGNEIDMVAGEVKINGTNCEVLQ
jgi:phage baseplate assembly protein V